MEEATVTQEGEPQLRPELAVVGAKPKKGGGKRPRPGTGDPKEQRTPAASRQPKGATCFQCNQAKTKCCGKIPCTRCFRMNLPCRKKLVKKGASAGVDPTPIIDLVIEKTDPRPFTEIYMQAFSQLYNEGLIDYEKVLRMLRLWNTASTIMEGDLSWGVGARIAQAMGINAFMLEDTQSITLDVPEHARKLRAQQEANLAIQDTKRLKETMLFKMADDGIRGVYMDIKQHDRTSRATNDVYDAMHRSASDMTSDLMQRKTLVALLTASLVAPEDRFIYFRGMIEMLYAKVERKQTNFFKLFSRDGEVRLYISEGRPITVEGMPGILCTLERVPLSKYITSRTDTHTVIDRFRHFKAPTPAPCAVMKAALGEGGKKQRVGGKQQAVVDGGGAESGASGASYSGCSSGVSGSEGEEAEEPLLRRQPHMGASAAEAMMPFFPAALARRKTTTAPAAGAIAERGGCGGGSGAASPMPAAAGAGATGLFPASCHRPPRAPSVIGSEAGEEEQQLEPPSRPHAAAHGGELECPGAATGPPLSSMLQQHAVPAAGVGSRSGSASSLGGDAESDERGGGGSSASSSHAGEGALVHHHHHHARAPNGGRSRSSSGSSGSSGPVSQQPQPQVPIPAVTCLPLGLLRPGRKQELLQAVKDGSAADLFVNRSKSLLAALPPAIAAQAAGASFASSSFITRVKQEHPQPQQPQPQPQPQQQQQQYLPSPYGYPPVAPPSTVSSVAAALLPSPVQGGAAAAVVSSGSSITKPPMAVPHAPSRHQQHQQQQLLLEEKGGESIVMSYEQPHAWGPPAPSPSASSSLSGAMSMLGNPAAAPLATTLPAAYLGNPSPTQQLLPALGRADSYFSQASSNDPCAVAAALPSSFSSTSTAATGLSGLGYLPGYPAPLEKGGSQDLLDEDELETAAAMRELAEESFGTLQQQQQQPSPHPQQQRPPSGALVIDPPIGSVPVPSTATAGQPVLATAAKGSITAARLLEPVPDMTDDILRVFEEEEQEDVKLGGGGGRSGRRCCGMRGRVMP